jgi:cobyrinic acid a,c-diamide synthase
MQHLLVSAPHKSSGKTIVSIGLCAALRARGLAVQPFKKGPDFIDPLWLSAAAGRDCHNLDFHTMDRDEVTATFVRHASRADVSIIEGTKGLFDGVSLDGSDSNAALAQCLSSPVILVVDTRGMTRGIAPMIRGFQSFGQSADHDIRIGGVILNQVGGARHEGKMRAALEHYTDVPVLGAIGKNKQLDIPERHIGLVPASEHGQASETVRRMGELVAAQADLDRVLAVAGHHPSLRRVQSRPPAERPVGADIRLGIARDAAFGFYYPGDLEALGAGGAELITIDTLRDSALPDVDGLFLGGGFPEMHMEALSANASLRLAIRRAVAGGLPVYAECGGLMYLARCIRWGDRRAQMVGAIQADVVMRDRPQGRGYVILEETGKGPWPGAGSATIHAHEFHHSELENCAPGVEFAYRVVRGNGVDGKHDGIIHRNVLASYAHLRDTAANHWTERFLGFIRNRRRGSDSSPWRQFRVG